MTAVVVGGGLAGISAALRLADGGEQVTLVEKRPRLGGAAFSFDRSFGTSGLQIDNGQHVFLRCCEAYQWLLRRLGVAHLVTIQPRLDIPVLRPDGVRSRISRMPGLPAPAHLGKALLKYTVLRPADRARIVRGALALRLIDPADRSLDERTLGAFLREHGQNDATIEGLWGIVATATLNLQPDDASLALAAKVFRTGLLDHAANADIGYAAAPLGDLHSVAAARELADSGVEVVLGKGVDSIADGTVRLGDRTIRAEAVVLAVPPRHAFAIAPELARTPAAPAAELGTSPIVNVHVVYDRRVTDLPFAAGVGTPVQWVFDRSDTSGLHENRPTAQYLAVTVSAADDVIDVPAKAVQERFVAALAELFPAARRANVLDAFVTRERQATFRGVPGTWRMRASSRAGTPGVYLAGSWTDTGWPDTMESAVRSGIAAAEAALRIPRHEITEFAA